MLVYPLEEWGKYMINGKVRTFKKDTPQEIIIKAKELNYLVKETSGRDFFFFEEEEEEQD